MTVAEAEATSPTLEVVVPAVPACAVKTEPVSISIGLTLLAVIAANAVAGSMTRITVSLMGGVSPFAQEVLRFQHSLMPYYQVFAYAVPITLILVYLMPLFRYLRAGCPQPASLQVQR